MNDLKIHPPATKRPPSVRRHSKPKVIDLFAGAGLFGLGFEMEGYSLSHSYEYDEKTAAVNAINGLASSVTVCDLALQRPQGRCDVLIAGPPCQGFSTIGSRYAKDPRNSLCLVIPEWAKVNKPKVVVVENVPRFLTAPSFEKLCRHMKKLGYDCSHTVVNARQYGVAQNRTRSITFFSKGSLPNLEEQQWAHEITVRDALADLPSAPVSKIQHFCLIPTKLSAERISLVPYGGDIRDIHSQRPDLVPPAWLKVQDRIVDIWGRITWEGASNTIRTGFLHPSRGRFLHPIENRPITFREAARLQSVPDHYQFAGFGEQMARQIGNGVPTNMARAIARAVREVL